MVPAYDDKFKYAPALKHKTGASIDVYNKLLK